MLSLYFFKTDFCVYCKSVEPLIEELSKEYQKLNVKIITIRPGNIEEARKWHVRHVPTVIFVLKSKDGKAKQVISCTGDDITKSNLINTIELYLENE